MVLNPSMKKNIHIRMPYTTQKEVQNKLTQQESKHRKKKKVQQLCRKYY